MVSLETSQIKQITERFFHQSLCFNYFQNTIFCMNEFSSLRLDINVYGKNKSHKNQTPMNLYWSYVASLYNSLI